METNGTTTALTRPEKDWLLVFKRIEELRQLYYESDRDVEAMVGLLKLEPRSQIVRRTLIRNFAANVEAFVFMLKQITRALSNVANVSFTRKELARLEESESYIADDGQAKN